MWYDLLMGRGYLHTIDKALMKCWWNVDFCQKVFIIHLFFVDVPDWQGAPQCPCASESKKKVQM